MTPIQQFRTLVGSCPRHSVTVASIDIAIFRQVVERLVLKRIIRLAGARSDVFDIKLGMTK
jgi:hypothetical protein